MTYRNATFPCPHCGTPLGRLDTRDKWRCPTCVGVLVGTEQLEVELGRAGRSRMQSARPTATARPCPGCGKPMAPYAIENIQLDRCLAEGYVWFDGGELGRARASTATSDRSLVELIDRVVLLP